MTKYIYIVTRDVTKKIETGGHSVPNLGVHTSLKSAIEHFKSIKEDRLKFGYKCHWDIYGDISYNRQWDHFDYRKAYLESEERIEKLKIERWNLKHR